MSARRAPLRTAAVVVLAGATAGMLSGCGTAGGFPEGVSAVLIQQRSDVASREIQVRVRNDSDAAITVGDVALDDSRFAGTGTRAVQRESPLAAGASVDVRVALPPMDCAVGDDGTPRVTLDLVVDGQAVETTSEVADALDVLPGIHARECLGERLAAVAEVRVAGFTAAPPGETGVLRLSVTPTGEGEARLSAIESTPLLTYDDAGAPVHDLDVDLTAGITEVDIPLRPQRCDPHVVQEDKRGTVFTLGVEVDGASGQVDIAAPAEIKARMLSWVAAWCGFGS